MKEFILKISFFLIPLIFIFAFALYILVVSDEVLDLDKIIGYQSKNKALMGLAYSGSDGYIKHKIVEIRKPRIIALGTSRIMQFRDYFFKRPELFFNAGGAIRKIQDFNIFTESLQHQPEVMIIGLDQYFFNENWDDLKGVPSFDYLNKPPSITMFHNLATDVLYLARTVLYLVKKVLLDFIRGKIDIRKLSAPHIGLRAKMYNDGYRLDGSYSHARVIRNPTSDEDFKFKDTLRRIRYGISGFQNGTNVNPRAIIELHTFLQNAKKRNIYIIAFLPPFAPAVWNEIKLHSDRYTYMFKLAGELQPLFNKYSFSFFDFSDMAPLGADDSETIDGFHGTEKAYLRILIKICSQDTNMKKYCDINELQNLLANSYSSKEVKREIN